MMVVAWYSALVTGLVAGAVSVPHCAAMCGPIAASVCGARPGAGPLPLLRYQAGRLLGYGMLGLLAGQLGAVFTTTLAHRAGWWLPMLSAASLLWLARRLWSPAAASRLVTLGRPGPLSRLGRRLLAILPKEVMALGALSALLPCGALYAAALLATATAEPVAGVALMLGFAVSSGAALVVTGAALSARALRPGEQFARGVSVALVIGACLLAAHPLHGLFDAGPGPAPRSSHICH